MINMIVKIMEVNIKTHEQEMTHMTEFFLIIDDGVNCYLFSILRSV